MPNSKFMYQGKYTNFSKLTYTVIPVAKLVVGVM